MTERSTITAAIPVYDGARYIERALRSVLAQTLPAQRILVIDDASVDDTAEIVKGIASLHPEIELIQLRENGGPSHARNLGLQTAESMYVAFLDADDEWTPFHLQLIEQAIADSPDLDLAFAESGPRDAVPPADSAGRTAASVVRSPLSVLLAENVITQSCVVVNRERVLALGGYDSAQRYAEDYDLWLRMALRPDPRFLHLPIVTCIRHRHPDQVSLRHVDRMFRSAWAVRKRIALTAGRGSVLPEHVAPLHASLRSDLAAAWYFRNRTYLRLVLSETEWVPDAAAQTLSWRRRSAWQWPIWRGMAAVYDALRGLAGKRQN